MVNPSRDFWIVYGSEEEDEEGEEMGLNRRSPAAIYLIWQPAANRSKQVIEAAMA